MRNRLPQWCAVVVGLLCVSICVALWIGLFKDDERPEAAIWAAYRTGGHYGKLEITYPLDETLFPPEIVAPTFRWEDGHAEADLWLVTIEFSQGKKQMSFLSDTSQWTPSSDQWETIKARSLHAEAKVTVLGVKQAARQAVLSAGSIRIRTSKDEVAAPLFYREVNLPFIEAVKDPSNISWRFGEIASQKRPPIVLEGLPVCGNCHSFSADGAVLGMDVDYANDKGSYAITPVGKETLLAKSTIITWSDYRREDGQATFGLLSQVSPDGRYAISTVKDTSVFVPRPNLDFSQLFFPVKGILAFYDRKTRTFHALPGADDKEFVQSNPTWSPDGKYIVFARSKVHHLETTGGVRKVLLTPEECREFLDGGKTFLFDLYRIPFNGGKGGKAEPLEGASHNRMSNYFPRHSPDGKWIVFCRAKSYMLLQPDSELWIIPAEGGQARPMRCNTSRMNSWHSWSPNGKWLVFSSKANGPYTQLFLTHVDEQGRSTPPVVLSHFTAPDRAANIPEFVNVEPGAIKRISQRFVDDYSFVRAAREYLVAGDLDGAERLCRKALKIDPESAEAHDHLGDVLVRRGMPEQAKAHFARAIQYQPGCASAHVNLGRLLRKQGKPKEGIEHFKKAVEIDPKLAGAHDNWGNALAELGQFDRAIEHYKRAIEIDPEHASAHNNLGAALGQVGERREAIKCYRKAIEIDPAFAPAHYNCASDLSSLGQFDEAIKHYGKAVEINPKDDSSHYGWASALIKLGRVNQAIEHYERAIEINPKHAPAHSNLGTALFQRGKFRQAIEHYRKAIEINPKDGSAHYNWGNALCSLREFDQALEHYKRAVEINPGDSLACTNLGVLLIKRGEVDQAIDQWQKAVASQPESVQTRLYLSQALTGQGKFESAVAHLRKALETAPNHLNVINALAWELATCPDDDVRDGNRAVELAERACKATNYRAFPLMDTLAAAYAETGRFPEAVDLATKAADLARQRDRSASERIRRRREQYRAGNPYRHESGRQSGAK